MNNGKRTWECVEFEDGTKQYTIIWNGEDDLRKKIFEILLYYSHQYILI